jgi:hypothetical protein
MQDLALAVSSYQDFANFTTSPLENYILVNDVDLEPWNQAHPGVNWTGPHGYKGCFYGNGYAINNLYFGNLLGTGDGELTGYADRGLFRTLEAGAEIRDLTINIKVPTVANTVGSGVSGGIRYGGVVAYLDAAGTTKMTNVTVNGKIWLGNIGSTGMSWSHIGGLIGEVRSRQAADLLIQNCVSNVEIVQDLGNKAKNEANIDFGGITGLINNKVTIKDSYSTGKITLILGSNPSFFVGGIAGNIIANNAKIENCYSTSILDVSKTVTGSAKYYVGGIAGAVTGTNLTNSFIKNSVALNGSITETKHSGQTQNFGVARVLGFNITNGMPSANISNNFALVTILVNGNATTGTAGSLEGLDKAATDFAQASTWTSASPSGLGWDPNIWDFTRLSQGYPTLKQSE